MCPKYGLSDIVSRYGIRFVAERPVLKYHQKVLGAIEKCRTGALGGHLERCTDCGEERHRLQSIGNGEVAFSYKDYREGAKTKTMTLPATDFLRRFCPHILPKGFRKIRHWGILSSRNKAKLKGRQAKMDLPRESRKESPYANIRGNDFDKGQCPCCKNGCMEIVMSFRANAPPLWPLKPEYAPTP